MEAGIGVYDLHNLVKNILSSAKQSNKESTIQCVCFSLQANLGRHIFTILKGNLYILLPVLSYINPANSILGHTAASSLGLHCNGFSNFNQSIETFRVFPEQ